MKDEPDLLSFILHPSSFLWASLWLAHSSQGSPGRPEGRNFSRRFCSSLAKKARWGPSLLACGASSM
jgi:hypothetical protein